MKNLTDDEILDELSIEVKIKPSRLFTSLEERLIAGFEEITQFYSAHKHAPVNDAEGDIFERIYATRLSRFQSNAQLSELVVSMDTFGVLVNRN